MTQVEIRLLEIADLPSTTQDCLLGSGPSLGTLRRQENFAANECHKQIIEFELTVRGRLLLFHHNVMHDRSFSVAELSAGGVGH